MTMSDEKKKEDEILADPVALIRQLDPASIERRLDEIEAEREALIVLLRAARRSKKAESKNLKPDGQ